MVRRVQVDSGVVRSLGPLGVLDRVSRPTGEFSSGTASMYLHVRAGRAGPFLNAAEPSRSRGSKYTTVKGPRSPNQQPMLHLQAVVVS